MSRESNQTTFMLRSAGGDCNDIFAVNPLRRSAWIVGVSWLMLLGPAPMPADPERPETVQ